MGELKKKSVKAIKWNTLAQVFNYLIKFTLGVFLARLLSPQEFGLVAMVTVITELSNFLIDGGFSGSLIQKKDIGIRDYSTVFYVNIALGVFFAFLIFFLAPVFVRFYNEPRLLAIARVISAVYILYSLTVVPRAHLARNLDFQSISIIEIITQLISGIIAVILALRGFSYWALVSKIMILSFSQFILYYLFSSLRIRLFFSIKIFLQHWKYSSMILISGIFKQLSDRIDLVVVGKISSAGELGLFQRGKNYAFLPVYFTSSVINRTLFSSFSRIQDDLKRFLDNYIKIYRLITALVLPVILLVLLHAEELIYLLIGSPWLGAVPYLRLFCLAGILYVLNVNKFNLLSALGFPKYNARFNLFELIFKPAIMIILVVVFNTNLRIIVWIFIGFYLLRFIYSSIQLSRRLDSRFLIVAFSNYKELIFTFVSFVTVYWLKGHFIHNISLINLIITASTFIIIYTILLLSGSRNILHELKAFSANTFNKRDMKND